MLARHPPSLPPSRPCSPSRSSRARGTTRAGFYLPARPVGDGAVCFHSGQPSARTNGMCRRPPPSSSPPRFFYAGRLQGRARRRAAVRRARAALRVLAAVQGPSSHRSSEEERREEKRREEKRREKRRQPASWRMDVIRTDRPLTVTLHERRDLSVASRERRRDVTVAFARRHSCVTRLSRRDVTQATARRVTRSRAVAYMCTNDDSEESSSPRSETGRKYCDDHVLHHNIKS